jgi:mannose-6-phosphate isomerase-like protein (cupin superfamily)
MKFTLEEFLAKLPLPANEKWKDGVWDVEPFNKSGVTLVFFAPRGIDHQTSHDKDEFYFVVRGSGELVLGDGRIPCKSGDVLFVEAFREHHFESFTDDFATWAVFF